MCRKQWRRDPQRLSESFWDDIRRWWLNLSFNRKRIARKILKSVGLS